MRNLPKQSSPKFVEWFGFLRFAELVMFAVVLESVLVQSAVFTRFSFAHDSSWKAGLAMVLPSLWITVVAAPVLLILEFVVVKRRARHREEEEWWAGWWPLFAGGVGVAMVVWPLVVGFSAFSPVALFFALAWGCCVCGFSALYITYVVRLGDGVYWKAMSIIAVFALAISEAWSGMLYYVFA